MKKHYKEITELYWIAVELETKNPKIAERLHSLVEELQTNLR
jgi:hypothetical protein